MVPAPPCLRALPAPPDDDPLAAGARSITARLQAAGHETYWAGGCVRDLLLGTRPRDYDIATAATPDQVTALFPNARHVGKAFGVTLVSQDAHDYDVATFRQDHAYHDGRHPEGISFTDARTDAERRDFTINALFGDPVAGVCIDYAGGLADLDRRLIRTVGDPAARFAEDRLRLLRAARFTATLAFTLDPPTAAAVRAQARDVCAVSPERIRDELVRLLTESPRPGAALWLLDDLGLLEPILPEVAALKGQAQPPEFHPEGDVFTHTGLMLDQMTPPVTAVLAFAVLLHDIGKPPTAQVAPTGRIRFNGHAEQGAEMADAILQRLRFSNADRDAIVAAVRGHMHFQNVPQMRRATLRRFVGRPHFSVEMELHRLDCLSSHRQLGIYEQIQRFRDELADEPVLPTPWVRGADLIAMGLTPGPTLGQWLRAAYEAQLEGQVPNREALLLWVRQRWAETPPPPPTPENTPIFSPDVDTERPVN